MLSARPLASRHAKLDLIWHLFSNINILFWCENSLAMPWTASIWWMMPEMEEDVFIFSWLPTCRADWNGFAIVYKFFWSDPSLWTYLSWPWPLGPLSYWPEAAVYTACHVQIIKAMNLDYQCFSPLGLFTYFCKKFLGAQHFCPFQGCYFPAFSVSVPVCNFLCSQFCSAELYGVCTSASCTVVTLRKLKSNFTVACHGFCVQAR